MNIEHVTLKNAKYPPQVLYVMHMEPGVAEYKDLKKTFLIEEEAIKKMDPTFAGRPIYVLHVDDEPLETIQADSAGYVIESFFNPLDGKHWAKIICVSDAGHEAFKMGWKVSNCYEVIEQASGGEWHGVSYDAQILRGEYRHMAIVPNPRYENSVVLTPEEFKTYNQEKELELKRLANSKDKGARMNPLKIFKRTKVENAKDIDLESCEVEIKEGKFMTIRDLVKNAAGFAEANPAYAGLQSLVKVGDKEMTVEALTNAYNEAMEKKKNESEMTEDLDNESDEEAKEDLEALVEHEEEEIEEKRENAEEDGKEEKGEKKAEKMKNAKSTPEKQQKMVNYLAVKNAAAAAAPKKDEVEADLAMNQVQRGKTRYGS
jgi:hypothetical protein